MEVEKYAKKLWIQYYPDKEVDLDMTYREIDKKFTLAMIAGINRIEGTENVKSFKLYTTNGILNKITKIYKEHLLDFNENYSELKYKYLSKSFMEKFELSNNNKRLEIEGVKNVLKNCFENSFKIIDQNKKDQKILKCRGTEIILSSSGMCNDGNMLDLIKKYHNREDIVLLLTGYQAEGTNGHHLKNLNKENLMNFKTNLNNLDLCLSDINFEVQDLSPYFSGHADKVQLGEYIHGKEGNFENNFRSNIFINHGEQAAREELKEYIESLSDKYNVILPKLNIVYNLSDCVQSITEPLALNEDLIPEENSVKNNFIEIIINGNILRFPQNTVQSKIKEIIELVRN